MLLHSNHSDHSISLDYYDSNGGDREFMQAYIIKGIPRFILLDREGKIINSDMSRPSDAKTAETFRSLKGI